ncbi:L-fucose isomerase [Desnuesiella massiliensis]|uniref:L-fucose isomerase n=1 Tax=Desnuesiella massiliensis TaxID=1650662 RepID=UPI0006E2EF32|nr:L-fucose isomerase [Desnuesiella massiliensis]
MSYPKIGIRPTIDGRWGGIREALEEQTMNMAKAAARYLEENLRYPDGTKVQCIISDTTIGGAYEASKCAEKFSQENVCATLTVTPCWCYGTETMDLDPLTIKAVWGFNGTERPGAVYLAAVMAAYAQKGLPAFSIYSKDVQDMDNRELPEDVKEKILRFGKCAIAIGLMRNKSYVNMGSVSMGIMGSFCDPEFFQKYLGIRAEWVDMTEILRRVNKGIYDAEEYERALKWTKENCKEGYDLNPKDKRVSPEQKEEQWKFVVKMTLACRDIMLGNPKLNELGYHEEAMGRNAIAGGFQGQRMWTDWLPNGDFTEAILNSSFSWDGKKEPVVLATENDTLNGVAMLFGKLITGTASIFADVRTYWSPEAVLRVTGKKPQGLAENGFIHLINSGSAALDAVGLSKDNSGKNCIKRWWDMEDKDIKACLEAVDWCPANLGYFRGGGYSSHFRTQSEMPITLIRVNLVQGIGPVLQIAEGHTVTLEEDMHKILDERTDRTWPTTWFVPRLGVKGFEDVYSVMKNWGANHGAFSYGHIGKELITLASMLRIPVSLHNIEDKDIFRPHSFAAFGTKDLEAADYRACAAYGPLYK